MQAIVNIGLIIGDGTRKIAPRAALAALTLAGVTVNAHALAESSTELTLVADIAPALTPTQAHALAATLEQDCIAQRVGDVGALHGPNAAAWGEFNPAYFLDLNAAQRAAA